MTTTTFVVKPHKHHTLVRHPSVDMLASLSMEMECPNCGAEHRHREYVNKRDAHAIGLHSTDTTAGRNRDTLTYDQLRELNTLASEQLFQDPPKHTVADCFRHLRSEIESLQSTVEGLTSSDDDW